MGTSENGWSLMIDTFREYGLLNLPRYYGGFTINLPIIAL